MRIRKEPWNLTKTEVEVIGKNLKLTSGYFKWRKEYLNILLGKGFYRVSSDLDLSGKDFVNLTRGIIASSTYAEVTAIGRIECNFGTLPLWVGGCERFCIRSSTYNLTFFQEPKGKSILDYNSRDPDISMLKVFLGLTNSGLPKEVFPILEDLVKDYQ